MKLVAANLRIAGGELDLIAREGEYLVFIEVKTRNQGAANLSPRLQMTKAKLAQVRKLAAAYLQEHPELHRLQPRFDFLGITRKGQNQEEIEHLKNAF